MGAYPAAVHKRVDTRLVLCASCIGILDGLRHRQAVQFRPRGHIYDGRVPVSINIRLCFQSRPRLRMAGHHMLNPGCDVPDRRGGFPDATLRIQADAQRSAAFAYDHRDRRLADHLQFGYGHHEQPAVLLPQRT